MRRAWGAGVGALLAACAPDSGWLDENPLEPNRFSAIDDRSVRVVGGVFAELHDAGSHLLARRPDASADSLFVIHKAKGTLCELAGVVRYQYLPSPSLGRDPIQLPEYIAFIAKGPKGEELRFGTLDCDVVLTLPNADLPLDLTPDGHSIVLANGQLLRIHPVWSQTSVLSSQVTQVHPPAGTDAQWIVQTPDELSFFTRDWESSGRWDGEVTGIFATGRTLYVSDAQGLTQLRTSDSGVELTRVLETDACMLAGFAWTGDAPWLAYYSPCADKRLVARTTQSNVSNPTYTLPVANVAPDQVRVVSRVSALQPSLRAYGLFDVDPESGLGTLRAIHADGATPRVAGGAALDQLWFDSGTLYVVADLDQGRGRMLAIGADDSAREIASGVPRTDDTSLGPRWFLGNYDGIAADLMRACPDCAAGDTEVIASRVPLTGYVQHSRADFDHALLSDFDGTSGTLRLHAHPELLTEPGVRPAQFAFLEQLPLPGIAYIANPGAEFGSGQLRYTNYELRASGLVGNHVSEFLIVLWPKPALIYTVQAGPEAGLWLARPK
ncbi:MAG TPA: hypothetical protein VFQ61_13715 [Polyangiaceae bacterium]|nr:hypothetical protein [Polyangiaceae bacterium]